jgi:hypothetical protein
MKTVERIIIKLIIIQAVFLFLIQIFLSFENHVVQLSKLSEYEGVNRNNYTKIIETFEDISE